MRQFSLRALFLLVLSSAILLAAWRALGAGVLVAALFAIPVVILEGSLRRAYLMSCLAVYGPFIVMATYTQLYVSCSHCKSTSLMLLPCGPALILVDVFRRWLDLPRPPEVILFAVAISISAALVITVAWLFRRRRWWWGAGGAVLTLMFSSFAAFVTLALIRA